METINSNNPLPEPRNAFREFMRSHTARFIIVGIMSLVMLIPLSQLGYLISERKMRQTDVTDELKTEWGGPVSYYGMILKVPITEKRTYEVVENGKPRMETETVRTTGFIYPQTADDRIETTVTKKYRGIFSTPIFSADISGKATFNLAPLMELSGNRQIEWGHTQIAFVTNDEARFSEISDIRLNGKSLPIEYQEGTEHYDYLLINATAPVAIDKAGPKTLTVSLHAALKGSQAVHYQSLATRSEMTMRSNWKDPAFAGTSLPEGSTFKVGKNGFESTWKNLSIGNGKSALHIDKITPGRNAFSEIRFIQLVDHYQLNERTIKYGLLVLVLTYAVFFLIQIVGKVAIHPLHYFMIGLALLLFYSLLLSFSEQIGFIPAYLIAATTIVVLIVWYARSILKSLKFAVMSGLSLGLLYAFLLVIVNLEVYALIVGSIGLLLVLAAIMSVTRKIGFDSNE